MAAASRKKNTESESDMLHKVVFLDRDGVINRDSPNYITCVEEFEFLPGSLEALCRLTARGFTCIVVTNQTAPARGLMTLAALEAIHCRLSAAVAAAGGRILDFFVCPHLPDAECSCRKPKPGLLNAARRKHGIEFSSAAMIGDSAKDIECALNAGVRTTVLVQTGNGKRAARELAARGIRPGFTAPDLRRAVDWIIKTDSSGRETVLPAGS
jgi:D-glycero-D-manno-heptose 1,7-bisphosphate phosphatase